jgi:hypothetical protein
VVPATVADAVRTWVPELADTLMVTEPLPLPLAPEAIESQDDCSDADQLHPACEFTANTMLAPARTTAWEVGVTV